MDDKIRTAFERFVPLSDDEWNMVKPRLTFRHLKKKEFLLREGERSNIAAFINNGLLRYYYMVRGEEHCRQFFFENGFATDYESFLTQKPSRLNIDAIEDSELTLIHHADMQEFYAEIPAFQKFGRLLAESLFIALSHRTASLLLETPKERYLHLMKERPKVMQRVPQYMVASYLGITPEALSRIRRRLAKATRS
jgi:CRP/FNR family transcriptional regulator, anaerobic regulatory protein